MPKTRESHAEEQATIKTRSKSTVVKEESKKRKSLEPQRDHEAAKRLKSDEQHIARQMKTKSSLFGLQAATTSAQEQAVVLRESEVTGAKAREQSDKDEDKSAGDDPRQREHFKPKSSSASGDSVQERQREESTSENRRSVPNEAQDGAEDDVIAVASAKQFQPAAPQQPTKRLPDNAATEPQANSQEGEAESELVPMQKLTDLKEEANQKIRANLEKLKAFKQQVQDLNRENQTLSKKNDDLVEKNDELKEDRNIWITNCRDVEQELHQWKTSKKTFEKEMRKELKDLDQEERKADMDKIKAQNKKDLQIKQQKHDAELRQMRQRMEDANEEVKEEKKEARALMSEAKKKLKEANPETNSLLKEKDKTIYRLNSHAEKAKTDYTRVDEERKRFRAERDAARKEIQSQIDQRGAVDKELVNSKGEIMRKNQQISDMSITFAEQLRKEQEKSALFHRNNAEMSQQVASKRMAVVDLNRANEKIVARSMTLEKEQEAHKAEIAKLKEEANKATAEQETSSARIVALEEELEAYKAEIGMLKEGKIKTSAQQVTSSARIVALEEELGAYKAEIEMLKEAATAKAQPTPPFPSAIQQATPVTALNNSNSYTSPAPEVPSPAPEAATTSSTEERKSVWHSLPLEPQVNFGPWPRTTTPLANTENTTTQAFDSDDATEEAAPPAQVPNTFKDSNNPTNPSLPSDDTMAITEATSPEAFSSSHSEDVASPTTPFDVSTAADEPDKLGEQNEAFQGVEAQTLQEDRDVTMGEDVAGAGEDQKV